MKECLLAWTICTVLVIRMAHRIWKETKQHPATAEPGNMLGSCLVSFHFLWTILSTSTVQAKSTVYKFPYGNSKSAMPLQVKCKLNVSGPPCCWLVLKQMCPSIFSGKTGTLRRSSWWCLPSWCRASSSSAATRPSSSRSARAGGTSSSTWSE